MRSDEHLHSHQTMTATGPPGQVLVFHLEDTKDLRPGDFAGELLLGICRNLWSFTAFYGVFDGVSYWFVWCLVGGRHSTWPQSALLGLAKSDPREPPHVPIDENSP